MARNHFRGTPLYLAPESVFYGEYEPPVDVWALGCVVLEMLTGESAWDRDPDDPLGCLLHRIGYTDELPIIPKTLSIEAQNFLKKCLVKDKTLRCSAEVLLVDPFVSTESINKVIKEGTARSPFDSNSPKSQVLQGKNISTAKSVNAIQPINHGMHFKAGKRKKTKDKATEVLDWPSVINIDSADSLKYHETGISP